MRAQLDTKHVRLDNGTVMPKAKVDQIIDALRPLSEQENGLAILQAIAHSDIHQLDTIVPLMQHFGFLMESELDLHDTLHPLGVVSPHGDVHPETTAVLRLAISQDPGSGTYRMNMEPFRKTAHPQEVISYASNGEAITRSYIEAVMMDFEAYQQDQEVLHMLYKVAHHAPPTLDPIYTMFESFSPFPIENVQRIVEQAYALSGSYDLDHTTRAVLQSAITSPDGENYQLDEQPYEALTAAEHVVQSRAANAQMILRA